MLCRNSLVKRALTTSWATQSRRDANRASGSESPLRRLLDGASSYAEAEVADVDPEQRWATQPYAHRPTQPPSEQVDPRETTVLLFPGQGAQHVGMGKGLHKIPAVRDLYDLASEVVGWDVMRVCTEGPEEELQQRCQTAVLVTALAALERVRDERPSALERVRAAAGFSLGEITALVWAGALALEPALRLVEVRTAAMRAASMARPGGMLTVWLAPDANLPHALLRAREAAARLGLSKPVCQVANYLYPGCKVVAGDEEALHFVERHGKDFGVRRTARVRVEGAFHTPLMAEAEMALREAVRAVPTEAPLVPVYQCAEGRVYRDARDVRRGLVRHVTRPVRWEQTLHALFARPPGTPFPLTLALGPGGALRTTLRQVNARAWDSSLQVEV